MKTVELKTRKGTFYLVELEDRLIRNPNYTEPYTQRIDASCYSLLIQDVNNGDYVFAQNFPFPIYVVGIANELTEEQMATVVDSYFEKFKRYRMKGVMQTACLSADICDTATESFNSLLLSERVYLQNPITYGNDTVVEWLRYQKMTIDNAVLVKAI